MRGEGWHEDKRAAAKTPACPPQDNGPPRPKIAVHTQFYTTYQANENLFICWFFYPQFMNFTKEGYT